MTFSISKCLLAAAVLAGAALSGTASAACNGFEYPKEALRRGEEGLTEFALLVRADGTVERSVLLVSTGYPDLDRAAQAGFEKCGLKPRTDRDEPAAAWRPVIYIWTMSPTFDTTRAIQTAAAAATKGDLNALLRLGLLLTASAKSEADRAKAFALVKSAAEQGHAPAQFEVGRRYEKGNGVTANLDEAMRWYKLAAAQEDILAVERLRTGVLTY
nr:TonB family protein [Massilia sp. JS1662]